MGTEAVLESWGRCFTGWKKCQPEELLAPQCSQAPEQQRPPLYGGSRRVDPPGHCRHAGLKPACRSWGRGDQLWSWWLWWQDGEPGSGPRRLWGRAKSTEKVPVDPRSLPASQGRPLSREGRREAGFLVHEEQALSQEKPVCYLGL